jgi:hypothetical protein
MRYSPRDLRAADMLALILVGVGVAMLALGALQFPSAAPAPVKSSVASDAKDAAPASKMSIKSPHRLAAPGVRLGVAGFVLSCLGTALCFKVRQLIVSGGNEPHEDDHPAN